MARIKTDFGGQSIRDDEIIQHNKEALSQMDRKIKENIDLLKNEVKKIKENDLKRKENEISKENENPLNLSQYLEVIRKYMPVKVSGMDELREMVRRELDQFKVSDLNSVPSHVMVLSLVGLAPFLIPCANVIFFSGYTPGMEFIQVGTFLALILFFFLFQCSNHDVPTRTK